MNDGLCVGCCVLTLGLELKGIIIVISNCRVVSRSVVVIYIVQRLTVQLPCAENFFVMLHCFRLFPDPPTVLLLHISQMAANEFHDFLCRPFSWAPIANQKLGTTRASSS